jgi:hypothetical protein
VDRIFWQGTQNTAALEHDRLDGRVVGQHRDHDLGAACLGNIVCYERTLCSQGFGSAARAIVGNQAVTRFAQVECHGLPHMAQPAHS